MPILRWLLIAVLFHTNAYAEEISILGRIEQSIPTSISLLETAPTSHPITLLKLHLSDKAQKALQHRTKRYVAHQSISIPSVGLPTQQQLGMNHVPVLDQGSHGTCVMFANTAAIDAALSKGDYISQLCPLMLGTYLQRNAHTVSGWNGSWGPAVLHQLNTFGIVSKERQQTMGCAGLTQYPTIGNDPSEAITPPEYHQLSETLSKHRIFWTPLFESNQVAYDEIDMDHMLNYIKTALNKGDRLTFGVLLIDFAQGTAGAVGSHRAKNDSWVLTPEIANDIYSQTEFAGHEMIITGYDDAASATDAKGRVYYGLLTLRNSWGKNAGDDGNFYMSYDYFKTLALEAQRIRQRTI